MRLDLECDDCGYLISRPGTDHTDWHALWGAARELGWDGEAQHTGRHSCPDCTPADRPTLPAARRPSAAPTLRVA